MPTSTGTSGDASVTDTGVWQFALSPSDVAYRAATPTDDLSWERRCHQ